MKKNETRKIVRAFVLTTVWIAFFSITLAGVMTAGARTKSVMTGEIAGNIETNQNLSG